MADSFTLAKGEIMRLNYTLTTDGETVTIDPSWEVASYMQKQGDTATIDLAPTIADGIAEVEYDTVDLDVGTYQIDFRVTQGGNNDVFSVRFFFHLIGTITPPSTR